MGRGAAKGSTASSSRGATASEFKLERARALGASDRRRGRRPRRGRSSGSSEHLAETGRVLVHPFDDPLVMAGPGHGRARDPRGRARRRRDRRSGRRRRPRSRGSRRRWRRAASASSASSPRARPRCRARSRPGKPVAVSPRTIASGLDAPFAGGNGARGLPAARRRGRHGHRRGDRGGDAAPLRRREARLRARRCGRGRGRPRRRWRGNRSSPSSPEATWGPKSPLLSWLDHEGGHPSRVRRRARHLLVRQRVHDALDEGRAPRRGVLRLPPVLHGQAEADGLGRPRRALPAPAREGRRGAKSA